jgi:hypothetical protein
MEMKIRKTTTVMIKALNLPLQTPKPPATKKKTKKKKANHNTAAIVEKTSLNPRAEAVRARVPGAATGIKMMRRSWKMMKNKNKDYMIENKSNRYYFILVYSMMQNDEGEVSSIASS